MLTSVTLLALVSSTVGVHEWEEGEVLVDKHGEVDAHSITLVSCNFRHVQFPIVLAASLFLIALAKLGFHSSGYLSSLCPESCLLIVVGIMLSIVVHITGSTTEFVLHPHTFFLYLLPPIMLEAAFSLRDRAVWDNIGTILVFACLGTVFNAFIIGPVLFGLGKIGVFGGSMMLTMTQCLLFSSLISAVDPVAVLAIFQEINVNASLYFIVFGESLLNDAVTVVLYRMMELFVIFPTIHPWQIVKGVLSFFFVSLGGAAIGTICALFISFVTRFTQHVRVIEPLLIYTGAYFAYLLAECFELSGIISIICCGILLAHYAFPNISRKSHTVITCSSKLLSATSDCIIFLFLGMEFTELISSAITRTVSINWSFLLCTLLLVTAVRFSVVVAFSSILNKYRLRKIRMEEQLIMGYGGLRGAVCFSLVKLLHERTVPHKDLFVSACLFVIFFTVFVQGISMKPFVKLLQLNMEHTEGESMNRTINLTLIDHVMGGLEEVIGQVGDHKVKDWLDRVDSKYIRVLLQRDPVSPDTKLMNLYSNIMIKDHIVHVQTAKERCAERNRRYAANTRKTSLDFISSMISNVPHFNDEVFQDSSNNNSHAYKRQPSVASRKYSVDSNLNTPATRLVQSKWNMVRANIGGLGAYNEGIFTPAHVLREEEEFTTPPSQKAGGDCKTIAQVAKLLTSERIKHRKSIRFIARDDTESLDAAIVHMSRRKQRAFDASVCSPLKIHYSVDDNTPIQGCSNTYLNTPKTSTKRTSDTPPANCGYGEGPTVEEALPRSATIYASTDSLRETDL